jgi:phosphoglycolate/pyridoxal phosphate phosphatase family enzyme
VVCVFDLDGVVYLGNTPIPGAIDSLNGLAEAGHALYFLTNNSTARRDDYVARLSGMGFRTDAAHVMTSAYATALHLAAEGAAGKAAFVVGEAGLAAELESVGVRVLGLEDAERADYVVAGLDRGLTYAKLLRAHREIVEHGACFVATNRDATYPMETGEIPGGGAIVAPIETSTGVRGITIGKPEPGTWRRILALAGAAPAGAIMVGDRPETDIMGAKAVGLHTALVLTGVTSAAALPGLPAPQRPDHVLKDLTELPALVASLG